MSCRNRECNDLQVEEINHIEKLDKPFERHGFLCVFQMAFAMQGDCFVYF